MPQDMDSPPSRGEKGVITMAFEIMTKEDELIDEAQELVRHLLLPSGSGFDFDWKVDLCFDGNIECTSYYEGCPEGFYLSPIPVKVVVPIQNAHDYVASIGKLTAKQAKILEEEYEMSPEDYVLDYFEQSLEAVFLPDSSIGEGETLISRLREIYSELGGEDFFDR